MLISRGIVVTYSVIILILYFNKVQTDYIYLTAVIAMLIESLSLTHLIKS